MHDFDRVFWQHRELLRALDELRAPIEKLALGSDLLRSLEPIESLVDRFTLPPAYLKATAAVEEMLARVNQPALANLECLSKSAALPLAGLGRVSELLAQLSGHQSMSAVETANQRFLNSLVPTEALLRVTSIPDSLADFALRPQLAFGTFVEGVSSRLSASPLRDSFDVRSLLDASAALLDPMSRGTELAALLSPDLCGLSPVDVPTVNLYEHLQVDLDQEWIEAEDVDAEDFVAESNSGKVARLGAKLVGIVYDLNVESEREGRPPVFKPTTKSMMAFSIIPTRIASSEESFFQVVDYLYFLLYEGSGSANRLTERADADSLSGLWTLKQLRLGARHDIDHGSSKDVQGKSRKVGESYRSLIGRVLPRARDEWMLAQVELYRILVKMLDEIWRGEAR